MKSIFIVFLQLQVCKSVKFSSKNSDEHLQKIEYCGGRLNNNVNLGNEFISQHQFLRITVTTACRFLEIASFSLFKFSVKDHKHYFLA